MTETQPYILLIDDDEDDLEILSTSLELMGVKTRSFNSGEKFTNFLKLIPNLPELPVLIILDYNMPRINGQELLVLLKSKQETKDIPVVMYSTSVTEYFKNTVLDLGAINCFTKPAAYSDFIKQVCVFKDLACSYAENKSLAGRRNLENSV